MKCFKQTLFSLISSIIVMIFYFLISIYIIKEIKQDTWQILSYIGIIVLTLILNFIFGYIFTDRLLIGGYLIQFIIMLLISSFVIYFENTFIAYIGIIINPIYTYIKEILWYFNAVLSDTAFFKIIISVLSSILPCVFMFLGAYSKKHKL